MKIRMVPLTFVITTCVYGNVLADVNIRGQPTNNDISSQASSELQARPGNILSEPDQLTPTIRLVLGLTDIGDQFEESGSANHPYTTRQASAEGEYSPIDTYPWRATGKLLMDFDGESFSCTASVIDKSLLVTAAHCIHNFGAEEDGFADSVTFEPARHGDHIPYGKWVATEWWIPKSYYDGSDVCSESAPVGVVCENDLAVVVTAMKDGESIGDVVGTYALPQNYSDPLEEFGYVSFLGQTTAQFTQLGYPTEDYNGDEMVRTDSLGYQDFPGNVVIGSSQTPGSSGGPWLQNFGSNSTFIGELGKYPEPNMVTGVTSWGYSNQNVKIQGASRFMKNSFYKNKTNIRSLVDDACGANSDSCYARD